MGHEHQTLTHRMTRWRRRSAVFAWAIGCLAGSAQAEPPAFAFDGDKAIVARTRDGQATRIGTVRFRALESGRAGFEVRIDPAMMRDYFLSMREFKCLPAEVEVSCHVPYPYPQPATVSAGDLTWLEHSLLFFYKRPADFGAMLWNGVIYHLHDEGGVLVGAPQSVDLNLISAPPERNDRAPFGPLERSDIAPGARWITELRIE